MARQKIVIPVEELREIAIQYFSMDEETRDQWLRTKGMSRVTMWRRLKENDIKLKFKKIVG